MAGDRHQSFTTLRCVELNYWVGHRSERATQLRASGSVSKTGIARLHAAEIAFVQTAPGQAHLRPARCVPGVLRSLPPVGMKRASQVM
jgi:hypothetical protein